MIVYAVYRNDDMTEGRGPMVLDRLFRFKPHAVKYVDTQPGLMGRMSKWSEMKHGDWNIKEIELTEVDVIEEEKNRNERVSKILDRMTAQDKTDLKAAGIFK